MNLSVLKNKNYVLVVLGRFVSEFGTYLQSFALSLFVLEKTGSPSLFASVIAISVLPRIILMPFTGVLSDRFSRKKMIVLMDILSGIFVMGVSAAYMFTDDLSLAMIYVIVIALNTIKQAGVYLNYIYLAAIALLSFLISYLLFTLHIMNNVSLLESRHIIKYKILKENYSTFELANKFKEDLEKEIKLRIKKNKWWRLKLINENDKFKIMIYHKIKRWISEKVNFVLIDDDFISIIYSSSMHGEGIAKICYDYVLYLERKKIIERKR